MKCGIAFPLLTVLLLIGLTGCVEKPASRVEKTDPPKTDPEVVEVAVVETPAPSEEPPKEEALPPAEPTEPISVETTEPEATLVIEEAPAPKVLDPATQARVQNLESQIAKLSENLDNARTTITEAKAFHVELAAIYKAEEEKLAAEKAERVFERMRRSSCGG